MADQDQDRLIRFTFNAGPVVKQDIDWLCETLGMNQTEVLRAAVRFYRRCRALEHSGGRVLIKEGNEEPSRVWFT